MPSLKDVLGAELFEQVAEKLDDKTEIAIVSDGSWFPKEKFDAVNEEKKGLASQLKERDAQLVELQAATKDSAELTAKLNELETANKEAAEKHAAALRSQATDFAIRSALTKERARNDKTVIPLLDLDKVVVKDDGTVVGLDEQIAALKKDNAFLFDTDSKDDGNGAILVGQRTGEGGKSVAGKNPWKADTFSLDDQSRIYKENPELATQLMAQAKA